MKLENGYKVIYEVAADGKRSFYASKTGVFEGADLICEAEIGKYKLIYEKDGCFYGSESGFPTKSDYCFEDLKVVFVKGYTKPTDEENGSDEPVVGEGDENGEESGEESGNNQEEQPIE